MTSITAYNRHVDQVKQHGGKPMTYRAYVTLVWKIIARNI